ncbi:hypothetical protein QE152_g4657 [Popillia japonica]|uniref:Uncharacterized protein n=1 Tax=Popillia japonica TaxID=7064 RepID=A0AAW1MZS4_POPJA
MRPYSPSERDEVPFIQRPPKPLITSNIHLPKAPKTVYDLPGSLKPNSNKIPKLQWGPPKSQYGPPPKLAYGPPKQLVQQYGPPEPVIHEPPHPGITAPATPPDIKYDGWQPIPGLVSRPPSDIYGVPNQGGHDVNDLQISTGFLQENFKGNGAISDSYGAPLNTVTGSGGVVASFGEHHQQSQGGLDISVNNQEQHNHQNNINVGLFAIGVGGQDNSLSVATDTYGAPPISSYSPAGPYPAASYKTFSTAGFGSAFSSYNFGKEISLAPTGVGLIPPSGVYGATPNSQYGTPLFQPANQQFHGAGQKYHQPRKPVVFREAVPVGLIQSIGNIVNQKDASGIIDTIHLTALDLRIFHRQHQT